MELHASDAEHGLEFGLEQLQEMHREADARLRQLERHIWLSPDEQVELARLKKQKLHLKDRMRELRSTARS